jgi:hypothetical protein
LCQVLPETERLLREWLPTKSRQYPAAHLADEVAELRATLLGELDEVP